MSFRMLDLIRPVAVLAALVAVLGATAPEVRAQEGGDLPAVLITGTSSGIGLRMTEVLSQNGFFVYAGARKPEDLARLDAMENVKSVRLDVTIPSEIDAAVALVEAEGRGLYGLINNAGVAVMGPLIELPEEELDFQLDVNLYGPYRVTKAFANLLIESRGRVLTTGSIAGIVTGPYSGAYSMSKHGVEAYTDALAAELAEFGVQVAVVEPGNYKSKILASMVRRMEARGYSGEGSRYPSMRDLIRGPLDRSQYDEPDDVALAALDFMSSDVPKRRYMVVPNQGEADLTLRQGMREIAQLNQGHAYSRTRDELVAMLDDALQEAPPGSPQESGSTSDPGLHEAIVAGDLAAVEALLAAGADPNVKEPSGGSSPLITAAMFGRAAEARSLIEAGADVDQRNDDGSTALITAAFMAHPDIVQALLDAGADRSITNNAGSTALDGVEAPFEAVKGVYDYLGAMLGPLGLKLDYDRIRETRPEIAEMLR
jgi:NAD(P)-dependent dehydrogenase (short-subunit alcohol dehydrogenase family)